MSVPVVERARRYVAKCPGAISGQAGHDCTFRVAAHLLHGFALNQEEALALLREYNLNCVPPWSERELKHKIESVSHTPSQQPRGYLLAAGGQKVAPRSLVSASEPTAQQINPKEAAERFLGGFRCRGEDLADLSPVSLDGDPRFDGVLLVGSLYQPGELINVVTKHELTGGESEGIKARPVGKGTTLERNALIDRFEMGGGSDTGKAGAWLRMNPLDGKGIADVNVTAFRFGLLECDSLPIGLQISLFAKLPLPVAAILESGGRSVHAWIKVDAPDAEDYRGMVGRILNLLRRFGVDGKNKNPSRLSRLPGARREIGAVGDGIQRLLYLNPNPAERSIC